MALQTRRLEFFIVVVALLVLLLWSQPPKSGNAFVRIEPDEMEASEPVAPEPAESLPEATAEPETTAPQMPVTPRPVPAAPPVEVQPRPVQTGTAEANRRPDRDYRALLIRAQPSVRYVWNGLRFVPQKVYIVDEGNGITSTWTQSELERLANAQGSYR